MAQLIDVPGHGQVEFPDGMTDAQIVDAIKRNGAPAAPAKPMAQTIGEGVAGAIGGLPRQLGLTARYALEGPAQAAELVTEPLRKYVTDPMLRLFGADAAPSKPLSQVASGAADWIGLPKPDGANERVVADAARLVAGGGGMGAAARSGARAVSGVTKAVLEGLGANQGQQSVSAAGAGLLGGATREAGANPIMQAGASLLGGVAAPTAMNAGAGAARIARNMLPNPKLDQQVEQTLELTLRGQGIDWSQVPERVKQGMRAEAAGAVSTGRDLDPQAVSRLLDFSRVPGATPTRATLSLDPVQITREKNLAKTGANSSDLGLQGLAQVENKNNAALIGALNDAGARGAPDAYAAGQSVIGALQGRVDRSKAAIGSLYDAARDTAGRSAGLDGAAFTTRANQALDEGLLGGALPKSVADHMNRIAQGEVPFTVDYSEQLKTAIGKLQRASNDGQTRMALGVVRGALDDTPLQSAPKVNPGNLPAVPGTVPPSPAALGEESIAAFNQARQANRAFMQRVERTPALAAVMDGAEPDQFVRKFITGSGATVADVRALQTAVADNPQALQAVRGTLAEHLKKAALSGASDETGNFSQSAFNKALNAIGDRKMSAFFSADEIEQLRAVGRVASYMQVQPRGSAVNNSNSGALVLGRGLDAIDRIAGKLPLGLPQTIQGVLRGVQQREALRAAPSLLLQQPAAPVGQRLLPPLLYGGGLLSAPGSPGP